MCSSISSDYYVTVITSCRCQPCDRHLVISGHVFSSVNLQPLMLALVLVDREVVAVSDSNGGFLLDVPVTRKKEREEWNLVVQEPFHHPLELAIPSIAASPAGVYNVSVIMEYIAGLTGYQQLQLGFSLPLSLVHTSTQEAFQVVLTAQPNSFIDPRSHTLYSGAGKVLDTVYRGFPMFTSPALKQPIYKDSRGAEFAIFSLIFVSVGVISEQGAKLVLRKRSYLTLTLTFKDHLMLKDGIKAQELEKLHLFSFSEESQQWIDKGKVELVKRSGDTHTLTMEVNLHSLNSMWSVAVPVRVSCHVRISATSSSSSLSSFTTISTSSSSSHQLLWLQFSQGSTIMGLSATHQQLVMIRPGSVTCLKAVCSLGGRMQPTNQGLPFLFASPGVEFGVLFVSGKGEIVFYCNDKTQITSSNTTPYYPSLHECITSDSTSLGQFSLLAPTLYPSSVPTSFLKSSSAAGPFCYIKVAVLSCALLTNVSVVSLRGEMMVQSNNQMVLNPKGRNQCTEDTVVQQVATCLPYSCGTKLLVSAQQKEEEQRVCHPWSVAPPLIPTSDLVPSQSTLQLSDTANLHNTHRSGLYSSSMEQLAIMRCLSGYSHHPSLSLDSTVGIAVTFVC